jgi:hypothetical protein
MILGTTVDGILHGIIHGTRPGIMADGIRRGTGVGMVALGMEVDITQI